MNEQVSGRGFCVSSDVISVINLFKLEVTTHQIKKAIFVVLNNEFSLQGVGRN